MARADEKIFLWINSLAGTLPLLDEIVQWMVSDYLVPMSLAITLLGLWFVGNDRMTRQKHQIGVFVALGSMGLSSLTVYILNLIYFRPRPFVDHDVTLLFYQPTDSSFPSNPVAATFSIAIAVWVVNRQVGTVLIFGSALYGLSRVLAGVHYPLDVVAGALIGVVITILVFKLRNLLEPIPTWIIKAARIFCLA